MAGTTQETRGYPKISVPLTWRLTAINQISASHKGQLIYLY